ncbi:MAG: hypothetical protein ACTSYI_15770 [Promethearchaeota archaeon]
MPNWKIIVPILNTKANSIMRSLLYSQKDSALEINYYFCDAIMDLVQFIREKTKAKELGATHHVLKALFRWIKYKDRARLEISKDGRRFDIYVDDTCQEIEVKTISQMKVYDLWKKALGVIESTTQKPDSLWIFYFYRVKWPKNNDIRKKSASSIHESNMLPSFDGMSTCHYLLVFISIDLVLQDTNALKQDLIQLVEESLENVSKNLKIRPELIIPLENLIKVEDLERLVNDKDQALQNKDQALQNKDQTIQNQYILIQEKDQALQDKDKLIRHLKNEIQNLKESKNDSESTHNDTS